MSCQTLSPYPVLLFFMTLETFQLFIVECLFHDNVRSMELCAVFTGLGKCLEPRQHTHELKLFSSSESEETQLRKHLTRRFTDLYRKPACQLPQAELGTRTPGLFLCGHCHLWCVVLHPYVF